MPISPASVQGAHLPPMSFSQYHTATGGSYQKYVRFLSYVDNFNRGGGAPKAPKAPDPLAPIPYSTGLAQAQKAAAAQINPLSTQLNNTYNSNVGALGSAFGSYNKQLADYLKPTAAAAETSYGNVAGGLAASNAALTQAAQGDAGTAMSSLAAYLKQSGNAGTSVTQGMPDLAVAAPNLIAAAGTAAVNKLLQNKGQVGAELRAGPTIYANRGEDQLASAIQSLLKDKTAQQADLTSKKATISQSLYRDFVNHEIQKAVARATYGTKTYTDPTTGQTVPVGYVVNPKGQVVKAATPKTTTPHDYAHDPNYYKDPSGRYVPKGYRYNAQGQLVPTAKPATGGSTASVTNKRAGLQADAVKTATVYAQNLYNYGTTVAPKGKTSATPTYVRNPNYDPSKPPGPNNQAVVAQGGGGGKNLPDAAHYAERYLAAYRSIYHYLAGQITWLGEQQLKQLARQTLSAGGWRYYKTAGIDATPTRPQPRG